MAVPVSIDEKSILTLYYRIQDVVLVKERFLCNQYILFSGHPGISVK
jgi:hypothetical protein